MSFTGRLCIALLALLVLLPMGAGDLCAFCAGCVPAETSGPACHAEQAPVAPVVEAPGCCADAAALLAEPAPSGLVTRISACPAPAAEAAGQAATVPAEAVDPAPDPPLLHGRVRLHTLHSVFLI